MGSVVSHEFGSRNNLPPYVCVPTMNNPYAGSGYLSSAYGPFSLGADPAAGNFAVRDLSLPEGVDEKRFSCFHLDVGSRHRLRCLASKPRQKLSRFVPRRASSLIKSGRRDTN